jgi:serine/threonine-protein kinase
MVRIELGDHLSFPLQEPHRFSWISALGTVSCVFADQDSGNLAFGIQAGGQRLL